MGILKKADGDLTVATIAVRDALTPKFDGMQVMVLDASAIAQLGSGRALFQWSTAANDWLLLWAEAFPILQTMTLVNDHESRLDALESGGGGGGGGVQGVSAFLIATQANSTTTPADLNGLVFTVPAGKTLQLKGFIACTAAATSTGIYLGVKVSQGAGANANATGNWLAYVNVSSSATATGIADGDVFNVAGGGQSVGGVLGTASTAGNNPGMIDVMVKNNSTNAETTVALQFRSEVAGSAVTAQIGSGATGIIF